MYEIKANGSVVLHDLNTHVIGSGSSAIAVSSNPTGFTIADNQLFFSANDGNGTGIWEVGTNGAIFKTPESLTIGPFTAVQDTSAANTVLFNGFDSSGHLVLWETQGVDGDAVELNPAGARGNGLNPFYFTIFGDKVLFSGADSNGLTGLWSTDGTEAGTVEITAPGTFELTRPMMTAIAERCRLDLP